MRRIGTMLSVLVAMLAMSGLAHALGGGSASTDTTSTTIESTSTTLNTSPVSLPDSTASQTSTFVVNSTTLAAGTESAELVERTIEVLDAGRVSLMVGSDTVVLADVVAADGWTIASREEEPAEVEVVFTNGSTVVEFEAEVEDDGLEIRIETFQIPAPDVTVGEIKTYQVGDAGSVTIQVGQPLELIEVEAFPGWTYEIEVSEDEIEVEFMNGEMEAEFEAEWDEDGLEIEIGTSDSDDDEDDEDEDEDDEEDDDDDDEDDDD